MDAARAAVVAFNTCINARDLDGLARLMTDEHVFIDAVGGVVRGRQACIEAWRGFFAAFPDYQNHFQEFHANGAIVAVAGYSSCSDKRLEGPALWRAAVEGERIAEWRVLEDTPESRRVLGFDG